MKTKQQNPPQIDIVCALECVCDSQRRLSVRVILCIEKGGVYRFCLFIHLDPNVNYWRMREEVY